MPADALVADRLRLTEQREPVCVHTQWHGCRGRRLSQCAPASLIAEQSVLATPSEAYHEPREHRNRLGEAGQNNRAILEPLHSGPADKPRRALPHTQHCHPRYAKSPIAPSSRAGVSPLSLSLSPVSLDKLTAFLSATQAPNRGVVYENWRDEAPLNNRGQEKKSGFASLRPLIFFLFMCRITMQPKDMNIRYG